MKKTFKLIVSVFACLLVLGLVGSGVIYALQHSVDSNFSEHETRIIEGFEKNIDTISDGENHKGSILSSRDSSLLARTSVEFLEAKLRLYQWRYRPSQLTVEVFGSSWDNWGDGTLSWIQALEWENGGCGRSLTGVLDSVTITDRGWCEWDVLSFVQSDYEPTDWRVSFRLKATDETSGSVPFDAKEFNNAVYAPRLYLKYRIGADQYETTITASSGTDPKVQDTYAEGYWPQYSNSGAWTSMWVGYYEHAGIERPWIQFQVGELDFPDFDISVDPIFGELEPSGSVQANVTVAAVNGFSKPVNLSYSVSPLEPGITVEFEHENGTPTFTSQMTIHVDHSVPAQNYMITIEGVGDGRAHACNYWLVAENWQHTENLSPIEDAYVMENQSSVSGYRGYLEAGFYSQDLISSFIKFDLDDLHLAPLEILSARLWLYAQDEYNGGPSAVDVHGVVNDNWWEMAINWNNKPAEGTLLDNEAYAGINRWYNWDVTNWVQSQFSNDKIVSLYVKPGSTSPPAEDVEFYGKEYSYGKWGPFLEITYIGARQVEPDFSISASPHGSRVRVGAFTTENAEVTVKKIGDFGKIVNLGYVIDPVEPGITMSFEPTSGTPPFSSIMTVNVGNDVPENIYKITVTGARGDNQRSCAFNLAVTSSKVEHIVFIGLDGVRPDVLLAANTPNMHALAENGSYSWNAWSVYPSDTITNFPSIFTGTTPEIHGVVDWLGEIYAESMCEVFEEFGLSTALSGQDQILAGYSATYATGYHSVPNPDVYYTDVAIELFENYRPFFLVVYNPVPDHMGHEYGHDSPEYREAIENADVQIGRILAMLAEQGVFDQTLIVVTTDHGMTGTRQGDRLITNRRIFTIFKGPGVRQGYEMPNTIPVPNPENPSEDYYVGQLTIDTAPTITALAGLRMPADAKGRNIFGEEVAPTKLIPVAVAAIAAAMIICIVYIFIRKRRALVKVA